MGPTFSYNQIPFSWRKQHSLTQSSASLWISVNINFIRNLISSMSLLKVSIKNVVALSIDSEGYKLTAS